MAVQVTLTRGDDEDLTIEDMREAVSKLRLKFLTEPVADRLTDEEAATSYFLLGLNAMEQAERFFRLATLKKG